jgi:hypothetical protein
MSRAIFYPHIPYVNRSLKNGKTKEDMIEIFNEYEKEIFKNHKNCSFFKLFLLPWISIDTIENLDIDSDLVSNIRIFLNDCCNTIKDRLQRFPQGIFKYYIMDPLFKTDYQTRYLGFELEEGVIKVNGNPVLSFLNACFPLDSELIKVKKENENRFVLYKPDDTKELILDFKDKEKELNIISANNNTDRISLHANSIKQVMVPHPMFNSDLNIFRNDVKFMGTLLMLKKLFDMGYEVLITR